MKVWYILMTFPAPAQTYANNDLRAIRRLGNEISVHALRGPRRDTAQLLSEAGLADVEVTHATLGNIVRGVLIALAQPLRTARLIAWIVTQSGGRPVHLAKGLALLPRSLQLFQRVQRDQPDVVHIYWGHYPAIFGWLVLEYAPRVVVSLSLSAGDLLCDFPGSFAVARRAHLVSTWAAVNVPTLAARGVSPEAVHVSWQGLDVEKIRGRHFVKTPLRVVTASRLVAEKGMDDVIRAFARVVSKHPAATLVVLGEGPDRRRLEKLAGTLGISDVITFRGHVNHDEVFEELARAEVFLLLSRYEGERLPNVVKEAMACRCFVVTTATPGIDELLKDGTHGRVVPLGAWEQAAQLATDAFDDPQTARIIGEAAHAHILENFDLLQLMDGMVRMWETRRASASTPSGAPGALVSSI
jgi:glycosyltransferase involved in cell wall biosynthesis